MEITCHYVTRHEVKKNLGPWSDVYGGDGEQQEEESIMVENTYVGLMLA
jgi:hypothetical protein